MPRRRTKRGAERTPLSRDADVLDLRSELCGSRRRARACGCGARVLIVDRYEVGERQTSACAAPTGWLEALGLQEARCARRFRELVIHTPHATARYRLPWTFSTFDYRTLCGLLDDQNDAEFEIAKVDGRSGDTVHTDRGDLTAPLIVDAPRLAARAGRLGLSAARRAAVARPRGASARLRLGPRDLDRPPLRARRLRLELPGARRGAHRRRLVRPALPREGHHGRRWPRTSSARPSATRATGSRTGFATPRRTSSSSSATRRAIACRSPPRASAPPSTSASPAGASCGRWSRAALRAPRPCGATRDFSASHRWKFEAMLRGAATDPARAAARAGARDPRDELPALRRLVVHALPARSRRRRLRLCPRAFAPLRRRAGARRPGSQRPLGPLTGHLRLQPIDPHAHVHRQRWIEVVGPSHLPHHDLPWPARPRSRGPRTAARRGSGAPGGWRGRRRASAFQQRTIATLMMSAARALHHRADRQPLAELARLALAGAQLRDPAHATEERGDVALVGRARDRLRDELLHLREAVQVALDELAPPPPAGSGGGPPGRRPTARRRSRS